MNKNEITPSGGRMQDDVPLVTIVVPTFNQGSYLPACIDHCLFQTYEKLEIIIVDGGSTDSTKSYLKNLEKDLASRKVTPVTHMSQDGEVVRDSVLIYPQNRLLRINELAEDPGATATYNVGLKQAKGKYCTYVVGDDLPHPHMVEEMVEVLENQECDFVYSDMNLIDDDGRIIRQMKLPDYSMKSCLADWFHLGVSKLYRTDLHAAVGLMDERYTAANDYDHYLRFAMAGCRFRHLDRVLYSIRWHGPQRRNGQHTTERYKILIEESKRCAKRARCYLQSTADHSGVANLL